jgi:hypothetical protein
MIKYRGRRSFGKKADPLGFVKQKIHFPQKSSGPHEKKGWPSSLKPRNGDGGQPIPLKHLVSVPVHPSLRQLLRGEKHTSHSVDDYIKTADSVSAITGLNQSILRFHCSVPFFSGWGV